MSKLLNEIEYFSELFDNLQSTNSRIEKLEYIRQMPEEYKPSWEFVLECLDGKHPFGYKYNSAIKFTEHIYDKALNRSVKDMLKLLLKPMEDKELSREYVNIFVSYTTKWAWFFEPIVNRTLKLGIGRSLLSVEETAPMLAKKFDDKMFTKLPNKALFYLTEKLDGNRCIAYHDGIDWRFVSRNGKTMYVNFDMSQFPESMIFDGEVMTRKQTISSIRRSDFALSKSEVLLGSYFPVNSSTEDFTEASGIINTHSYDKDVVFNIFDIIDNFSTYQERRSILSQFKDTNDVRILPILNIVTKDYLEKAAGEYLQKITSQGGEGIMINIDTAKYQHKRTADLLKYKNAYTIDMRVVNIEYGKGKYEGQVGALNCYYEDNDKIISCSVGTGLSDEQRLEWTKHPENIEDHIVEVAYFSVSQDKDAYGTRFYSLRFPRLVKVRTDKATINLF